MLHPLMVQDLVEQRVQELREDAKRAAAQRNYSTSGTRRPLRRWITSHTR